MDGFAERSEMSRRRDFTVDEMHKIRGMREDGVTWRDIAKRLNIKSHSSLFSKVKKYTNAESWRPLLKWHPVETVPRNGEDQLVWANGQGWIAQWSIMHDCFVERATGKVLRRAVVWMPMPKGPLVVKGDENVITPLYKHPVQEEERDHEQRLNGYGKED